MPSHVRTWPGPNTGVAIGTTRMSHARAPTLTRNTVQSLSTAADVETHTHTART